MFESLLHTLGPHSGIAHLHSHPFSNTEFPEQGIHATNQVGNHSDQVGMKATHVVDQNLVNINGIKYVPKSYDGVSAFLEAKSHFQDTHTWNGLEGNDATKQFRIDELKMMDGATQMEAQTTIESIG